MTHLVDAQFEIEHEPATRDCYDTPGTPEYLGVVSVIVDGRDISTELKPETLRDLADALKPERRSI